MLMPPTIPGVPAKGAGPGAVFALSTFSSNCGTASQGPNRPTGTKSATPGGAAPAGRALQGIKRRKTCPSLPGSTKELRKAGEIIPSEIPSEIVYISQNHNRTFWNGVR